MVSTHRDAMSIGCVHGVGMLIAEAVSFPCTHAHTLARVSKFEISPYDNTTGRLMRLQHGGSRTPVQKHLKAAFGAPHGETKQ